MKWILFYSFCLGQSDIALKLLKNKANVNHVNKYKRSALYYAVLNGLSLWDKLFKYDNESKLKLFSENKEICNMLIEHGADVNLEGMPQIFIR